MRQNGIINPAIMGGLVSLGHTDSVTICDAGFPVPLGANVVDITLICGVPGFFETVEAVLREVIFEEYITFAPMEWLNPQGLACIRKTLPTLAASALEMQEFREKAADSKLFIRTAEVQPCCNIILCSASGVAGYFEQYKPNFKKTSNEVPT